MKRIILSATALSLLLTVRCSDALDQAFCALRDPSTEIYALFPTGNLINRLFVIFLKKKSAIE